MDEQRIADIIYNKLNYMYCDNCRYDSEQSDDGFGGNPCEDCNRKMNGWAISRSTCKYIAHKIVSGKIN